MTIARAAKIIRHSALLCELSIIFLAVIPYLPAVSAGFMFDDEGYIIDNPFLRDLPGLWRIWSTHQLAQYYPLTVTSFWIEYRLYGLNPLGYHIVNIILHAFCSLAVLRVARLLELPFPFWIAALFAVHPVHVETVAWVIERNNLLSILLYFLAFEKFIWFENTRLPGRYWSALILFLLALFAKTITCTLPAVLALFVYYRRGKITWRDGVRLVPFFLLSAVFAIQTSYLEHRFSEQTKADFAFSFFERTLIAAKAIPFYLEKLLWPHPLIFNYPRWKIEGAPLEAFWPVLLAGIAGLATLWLLLERRYAFPFLLAFFVISLFPTLGFFNFSFLRFSFVADHFQYLASAGGIALIVGAEMCVLRKFELTDSSLVAGYRVLIVVLLSVLTWRQSTIYQNLDLFFTDTIRNNACATFALNNYGALLMNRNELERAAGYFDRAIGCDPNLGEAYKNRAALAMKNGDFDRAVIDYTTALAASTRDPQILDARGYSFMRKGRFDEAVRDFSASIGLAPNYAEPYAHRGSVYLYAYKNSEKACPDLVTACRLGKCEALDQAAVCRTA